MEDNLIIIASMPPKNLAVLQTLQGSFFCHLSRKQNYIGVPLEIKVGKVLLLLQNKSIVQVSEQIL